MERIEEIVSISVRSNGKSFRIKKKRVQLQDFLDAGYISVYFTWLLQEKIVCKISLI